MSRHVTITRHPAVANCTRCDNLLVGRDDDMRTALVQGYRGRFWLAEFLCEPCARTEGLLTEDGAMRDEDVTALFDRMADRDDIRDGNSWGISYLEERDGYRRRRPTDRDSILAADRSLVDALGDDPAVLWEFATSRVGYHYARAVLFGDGYGELDPDLIGRCGPDAPTTFLNLYREEYRR